MLNALPEPVRIVVRQVAWFVAIGLFTTALYYVIAAALFYGQVMDLVWASGVGYGVGSLVNFGLQRWLTFEDRSRHAVGGQFIVYWVLQGSSLGLNMLLVWAFELGFARLLEAGGPQLGIPAWLVAPAAVFFASGLVLVFNFVCHKWITFNRAIWGEPSDEDTQ